jgi:hypothetical protein
MGKTIEMTIDVPSTMQVKKTWRIIDTDNFGGDYPDERFIAVNIRDEWTAEKIADSLNARAGENASRFYKVVPHIEIVYKLQPGFEP